jgi:hypothetical protein
LVLFALPVGYFFSWVTKLSRIRKLALITLVVVLVVFNLRLVYTYNRCFQGGDWDFQEYTSFFVKIRKYHQSLNVDGSERMSPENEYSKTMYLPVSKIYFLNYKKAVVRAEVTLESANSEALLVLAIENPDSTIYWGSYRLRDQVPHNKLNKRQNIEGEFWIPVVLPKNATIATYIWNKNKESLSISELDLYLE